MFIPMLPVKTIWLRSLTTSALGWLMPNIENWRTIEQFQDIGKTHSPSILLYKWFILMVSIYFLLLWLCDPTRVMASSFLRFLDHTQRRTTVGRTPLDE